MTRKWTSEQQAAIDTRNKHILVSAAAGSGKTAILVERIIRQITDDKNPIDIDELLVMTFTKAAALEMKERIAKSLEEELLKQSHESDKYKRLKRQLTLIDSAVFNEAVVGEALVAEAEKLGREYVIQVEGIVSERENKNPKLPTGDIEIAVASLRILNPSEVPPFTIEDDTDGGDNLRMKYRYLDLHHNCVKSNQIGRAHV